MKANRLTIPPLTFDRAGKLKAIIFAFCLLPFALSCGKVGAPVPPSRITERARELTVIQRGSVVFISWPAPRLIKQDSAPSYIERIDVYRLTERRDEPPVLDEDDFEDLSQIIGFLDRDTIEAQANNGRLQFIDRIDLNRANDLSNIRLRYAVRYVNHRGQMAGFSATTALEPALAIATAPTGLAVKDQSQDRIEITWNAPEANVDGSRPASIAGYNIYRRQSKREEFGRPLNAEILTETDFIDSSFRYEVEYVYVVRALSQGTTGLIESADSAPITLTPADKFAPAAPDPVSIASANGTISLFWPRSAERDVTGYNVYRTETPDDEKSWMKLNEQPAEAVTFHDDRVTIGRKYFYRVTAIDQFNNESPPSRVVGETANP
ncbi:MAG TPA: fibronectin type III domain-containing protein [Blastocatellia bacterium]